MDIIWGILLVGIYASEMLKTVLMMKEMLSGYIELKSVRELPYNKVKLQNLQNSWKSQKSTLLWGILMLFGSGYVLYLVVDNSYSGYLFAAFLLMFLMSWINLVRVILVLRYGDEAYLTNLGIVAIDGIYENKKCRIVVESELSEGESGDCYIHAYKKGIEYPYRFKILEREEVALEMVQAFKKAD